MMVGVISLLRVVTTSLVVENTVFKVQNHVSITRATWKLTLITDLTPYYRSLDKVGQTLSTLKKALEQTKIRQLAKDLVLHFIIMKV